MMTRNKPMYVGFANTRKTEAPANLFISGCVLLLSTCTNKAERELLPDWSKGYEESKKTSDQSDGGNIVDDTDADKVPEGFPEDSFGIAIPEEITYPIRLRKLDAAGNPTNEPCAVRQGDYGNPAVGCMMDMEEIKLSALGLKYTIVAPEGMCDFVEYRSYMFQNFPIGCGPTEVSCTRDENGNVIDGPNTENCVPRCPYDFSLGDPNKLNCCTGWYTLTIVTRTPKLNEDGTKVIDDNGNEVIEEIPHTFPPKKWGGKPAECFHGAAYMDQDAVFTDDGWPMPLITYIDRKAWVHTVTYDGPMGRYVAPPGPTGSNCEPIKSDNYCDPNTPESFFKHY